MQKYLKPSNTVSQNFILCQQSRFSKIWSQIVLRDDTQTLYTKLAKAVVLFAVSRNYLTNLLHKPFLKSSMFIMLIKESQCIIMLHCLLGLRLLCSKFTYYSFENFAKFSPIILLCLIYYSKILLRRYTYIRNTSLKIVESNEVKSWVLAANCKQVKV